MPKRTIIKAPVSDEFHAAIVEFCEQNGKQIAAETRRMWANRLKMPEFKKDKKMGRPRKDD